MRDRPPHRKLCPLLFLISVWVILRPTELITCMKSCETGPTVYRLYPRRLESLTICRCHYKGSTFSSIILRPQVLVWLGFEPATFCMLVWRSTTKLTGRPSLKAKRQLRERDIHVLLIIVFLV